MIERATVGLEQITQTRIEPWPQLRWFTCSYDLDTFGDKLLLYSCSGDSTAKKHYFLRQPQNPKMTLAQK